MGQTVVILGASSNPERYANKAMHMLKEYGHKPVLVNPTEKTIEGEKVYGALSEIRESVDTLTMYVNAPRSTALQNEILNLHPKRVIFNPGSENPTLAATLRQANVRVEEACTLVLLRTHQF